MKITLLDKKTISAFLRRESFEGRVLTTDGDSLHATWGGGTLIAKFDKRGKLVKIPSSDQGVKKTQSLLPDKVI